MIKLERNLFYATFATKDRKIGMDAVRARGGAQTAEDATRRMPCGFFRSGVNST